jgi:hypothetical protein
MQQFLDYLNNVLHIDPIIVLIVIAAGFFQEKYMCSFRVSKDEKTDAALKTLLVSFSVSIIYLVFKGLPKEMFAQYFLSYFLATSFYEMILRPFKKWLAKLGSDEDKKPTV